MTVGRGYIGMADIARALGPDWPTHRVRRWMVRRGAAVKIGAHWYTTRGKLRATFPEVFQELVIGEF